MPSRALNRKRSSGSSQLCTAGGLSAGAFPSKVLYCSNAVQPRLTLARGGGIMLHERFFMHKPACISSAALLLAISAVCSAQSVTSAHSGTLHYFDGDVSID